MKKPRLTPARIGTTVLLLVFVALKLSGQLDWSWWWVLSPYWIAFPLVVAASLWCRFRAEQSHRTPVHRAAHESHHDRCDRLVRAADEDIRRIDQAIADSESHYREGRKILKNFFDAFSKGEKHWKKLLPPRDYETLRKARNEFEKQPKTL